MIRLTHGPGCEKAPTIWANLIIIIHFLPKVNNMLYFTCWHGLAVACSCVSTLAFCNLVSLQPFSHTYLHALFLGLSFLPFTTIVIAITGAFLLFFLTCPNPGPDSSSKQICNMEYLMVCH